jgi:OFA family oxalate/formate antiporter-like MFS transporter
MGESEHILGMEAEKGRWAFVVIGMIINLCLGSIYSWSVFKAPLKAFLEISGPEVSASALQLPFMIFLGFFAVAMVLSGKYIEKYGPRKVVIVGGVLTGLGWLLASMASSINILTVTYGIVGGIGVGIAYGVPVAMSGRWFPDKRGLAVGLTVLGFGFSAFFTANIANVLIASSGVMNTFRLFGIAFIIIMVILATPLVFPPAGWKPAGWTPPAPKPGAAVKCELKREEMLKSKTFYGLWLCYFIGCLAGLMAISISADVAGIVGKEAVGAMLLGFSPVGFFAIFNGGGRPVFGTLTDKLTPKNAAILSFVLIIIACLMIWKMQTPAVYIISFAILWGCLGGWLAIAPTATASFFGVGDYPRCYGMVFLAYGAGALVGPYLAGYFKDLPGGSFINVFPVVVVLAAAGIIIAFLLMKPPVAKE